MNHTLTSPPAITPYGHHNSMFHPLPVDGTSCVPELFEYELHERGVRELRHQLVPLWPKAHRWANHASGVKNRKQWGGLTSPRQRPHVQDTIAYPQVLCPRAHPSLPHPHAYPHSFKRRKEIRLTRPRMTAVVTVTNDGWRARCETGLKRVALVKRTTMGKSSREELKWICNGVPWRA